MENNPRVVFERLFGVVGSSDSRARVAHLKRDRGILDSVTRAAADLGRQLGPSDRARLDEYLDGVRGIEARIQKAEEQSATELLPGAQPAGAGRLCGLCEADVRLAGAGLPGRHDPCHVHDGP